MKIFSLLFMIISISFGIGACKDDTDDGGKKNTPVKFLDITKTFSIDDFEKLKSYILSKGERETYRSFDNNNPHYSFNGMDVYLNAETGQQNINNDAYTSDFNEITFRDKNADPQYYTIHVVRKDDLLNKDITFTEGMKEEQVYLLNPLKDDIVLMKTNLIGYIEAIQQKETMDPIMELKENFSKQEFKNAIVGVWLSAFEMTGQKNIKCLEFSSKGTAKATILNGDVKEVIEGNYNVSVLRPTSDSEITLAEITIKGPKGDLVLKRVNFGLHNGVPVNTGLVMRIEESPYGTLKRM